MRPNSLTAYSVVLLAHAGRYLLLQRSAAKAFAPNRWTGIGGKVEPEEFADLAASARRELVEETGLGPADFARFSLRRALLLARPGAPLTLLLYFTAELNLWQTPACSEGRLEWVTPDQLDRLDVIETTRPVLARLIADLARDPAGAEPIRLGLAVFRPDGQLERELWPE